MFTLKQMGVNLISTLLLNLLLICNILGTLYGFIWYGDQLAKTPGISCHLYQIAQSLHFLCIVIICLIFNKHIPFVEALS